MAEPFLTVESLSVVTVINGGGGGDGDGIGCSGGSGSLIYKRKKWSLVYIYNATTQTSTIG